MHSDSTRPALSLLTPTGPAPRASAAALRTCWCGWQIVRSAAGPAELDWATHQVETHASQDERARVAAAVRDWEDTFAALDQDLPTHLLPLIVDQILTAATPGADQALLGTDPVGVRAA